MELNREYFRAIIFRNFQCGLTQQQCIYELNSFINQGPVFIDGMVPFIFRDLATLGLQSAN